MSFRQGDHIRDYVLPIVRLDRKSNEISEFLGTGFVVGERGGFLTAGHVVNGHAPDNVVALVVHNSRWHGISAESIEHHPTEDVAFIRLGGGPWKSFLVLTDEWQGSSADYQLWGYPADVAREVVVANRVVSRPDLVYSAGHVRRRIDVGTLPEPLAGAAYEVSAPGPGTSGSTLVLARRPSVEWPVFGVYVGDRQTRDLYVGYAAMAERFVSWQPGTLDRTLLEESRAIAASSS